MSGLTERELEIERLREQEGLTFAEIAKLFSIAPSRASQIYRDILRYRRQEKRDELYQRENTYKVTLELTLGDTMVLQRVLLEYRRGRESPRGRLPDVPDPPDVDYITAIKFYHQLVELDVKTRAALHKATPE